MSLTTDIDLYELKPLPCLLAMFTSCCTFLTTHLLGCSILTVVGRLPAIGSLGSFRKFFTLTSMKRV